MSKDFKEMISREIKNLLEETFQTHHGIFTDRGTSLAETLAGIDFQRASKVVPGHQETIAGHVFHTIFYMRVLKEYITEVRTGKTNWDESWTTTVVTQTEWSSLREELISEYDRLLDFIDAEANWENEDHFGGILGIAAHTAYHLGAIRQLQEQLD